VQALIGRLGVSLLTGLQTDEIIKANKRLADAATISADAAKISASAAEKSAQAAIKNIEVYINFERSHVAVASVALNTASDNDPNATVGYTFTNTGRTPATANDVLIECHVVGEQVPIVPPDST
jgi:hypothetical protein